MLKLLHAIYDRKSPLPQNEGYYHEILKSAQSGLISSQLYYSLTTRNLASQVPSFFLQALEERAMQNLFISTLIQKELDHILDQFERQNIEVMPLKGPLFAEKYFGSRVARGTSDIDLLVKPVQLDQAIQLVNSLGFTSVVQYEPEHFHRVFAKKMPQFNFPLNVEIHWQFLREKTSSLDMNLIWRDSTQLRQWRYVREPSDFHAFYLTCLHGWNHELISWKYFIDIIQMIHALNDQLSYKDLFSFAREQKTYRRIAHTLIIVYHEFPHLNERLPLTLKADSTFWWNASDLSSDHRLKATMRVLIKRVRQIGDYDNWRQKWVFLKRVALPDPVIMARIIGTDKMRFPRFAQYILFLFKCFTEIMRSIPAFFSSLRKRNT